MSRSTPFVARATRPFVTDDGEYYPAKTMVVALEALPLDTAVPKAYVVEVFGIDGKIGELSVGDLRACYPSDAMIAAARKMAQDTCVDFNPPTIAATLLDTLEVVEEAVKEISRLRAENHRLRLLAEALEIAGAP